MNMPELALAAALFYTLLCLYKLVSLGPLAGQTARNEGIKLTAGALSNIGVAFVLTGIIAPILQGATAASREPDRLLWFLVLFVLGAGLHLFGRLLLSDLRE